MLINGDYMSGKNNFQQPNDGIMQNKASNKRFKVVIYARTSTSDQMSCQAQINEIKKESERQREIIVDVIEEKRSAKDGKMIYDVFEYMKQRPLFYNIYLKAKNKEFDILRIWKHDRLCRSDFHSLIIRMFEDAGVKIIALRDSNDKTAVGIMGVLAQTEISKITERVALRHDELLKQNRVLSRAPLGYRFSKHQPIPDENKDAVIQIFNFASQGLKPKEICERVNIIRKINGKKITISLPLSTCKRVLSNKFYIGIYKFRGQEIKGNYETFISDDLFNRINNRNFI